MRRPCRLTEGLCPSPVPALFKDNKLNKKRRKEAGAWKSQFGASVSMGHTLRPSLPRAAQLAQQGPCAHTVLADAHLQCEGASPFPGGDGGYFSKPLLIIGTHIQLDASSL